MGTVPQRRIGFVFSSRDVAVREGEASTIESATENFDVIWSSHQSEEQNKIFLKGSSHCTPGLSNVWPAGHTQLSTICGPRSFFKAILECFFLENVLLM